MSVSKLGKRWVCFNCQASFFDLNKEIPKCPSCDANQLKNPKLNRKNVPRVEEESIPDENDMDEAIDIMDDDDQMAELESFEELEERMEKQDDEEDE